MAEPSKIDEILAEVQNFLRVNTSATQATEKANKEISSIQSDISKVYTQVATDAALVKATADTAALKIQKANQQAAASAGAVPGAAENNLNKLIQEITKTGLSAVQSIDKVNKENQTSFFDDPMLVLKNAFIGSDAQEKLKGDVARLQVLDSAIGSINKSLQDTFRTNNALAEPMTQGTIEANARLTAAASVLEAQKAQIESIKYDAASLEAIARASRDKISMLIQVQGLINTEENQKFQREQFDALKQDREDRAGAKTDAQQVDDEFLATIHAGQDALGVPRTPKESFKFERVLMEKGKRPDLMHYFDIGLRQKATGRTSYGFTPSEALETMSQLPNADIPQIRQATAQIILTAQELASKQALTLDPKDKEGKAKLVDKAANQLLASQYELITPDSVFNVGDLSNFLGKKGDPKTGIRDLFELPVSKKVLVPAIQAGVELHDAKVVLGLVRNAVLEGTLTTSEAAGLSDIYRKASVYNQLARGFEAWGLTVPEGGAKYKVRIGGFGNSQVIDMNDPVAISSYIVEALSQQVRGNTAADQLTNLGAP